MRVYFGVCGVGLGHVGRCMPVAKRLRARGDSILFSTYKDACDYVERENMPLCRPPPLSYTFRPDGGVDFRKTTANPGVFSTYIFLTQLTAEIEFIRGFKPDLVVSDSRLSPLAAAKLLDIPSLTILNTYKVTIPRTRRFLRLARIADGGILTIIGKAWTLGQRILIPDFPPPYTLSQDNLGIPAGRRSKIRFIGPILPARPGELGGKKAIRRQLGLEGGKLIFAPISGPMEEKEYITPILKRSLGKLSDDYRVVMSLGEPNGSQHPYEDGKMRVYSWLDNRFKYLKACDLVISRAGLGTLTQSICYGKPLLLIPSPSQTEQLNNAKRAEGLGVAKILRQDKLCYKRLESSVEDVLLNGCVEKAECLGSDLSRLNAVEAMVEEIIQLGGGL